MELGGFASGARAADGFRFGDEVANGLEQFREIERLLHQSGSASSERWKQLIGPRGNDDDRHRRGIEGDVLERFPAIFAWHTQIKQNEVNRLSVQNRESFGPVGSGENAKVLSIQKAGDGLA